MIIVVYRGKVWVSIDPPCTAETTVLKPIPIDSLMDALTQAVKQARGDKQS